MDTSDGFDWPGEAKNEDEQMEEARGNGQTEQSADKSSSRKNDEAPCIAEKENIQHGGSSSSTSQSADATGRRSQHEQEGKIRGHADRAARTSGISREEAQRQCQY